MDCGIPFCNNGCPVNTSFPTGTTWCSRQLVRRRWYVLHSTNNFPEFTAASARRLANPPCTLGINELPSHQIDRALHHRQGLGDGWVAPMPPRHKTGEKGCRGRLRPAGLPLRSNWRARGMKSRYSKERPHRWPDALRHSRLQVEKTHIDAASIDEAEGVTFRTGVFIGDKKARPRIADYSKETVSAKQLMADSTPVVIAGGRAAARPAGAGREPDGSISRWSSCRCKTSQRPATGAGPDHGTGRAWGDWRRRHRLRLRWYLEPSRRYRRTHSNCCRNPPSTKTSRCMAPTGDQAAHFLQP